MKFIRTYTNFSLIKEKVTNESEIEDWFSRKYYTQSRRGNTLFGLEKKDMVTKWGIVKDFEENLSKQDFNSVLDLQEFLWNKMITVIDKENDLRIIDKLNAYRQENNKKEITKGRFCDGFYGTQTDMVLGFVATLLKDELELTKRQEAAAKKSAEPLTTVEVKPEVKKEETPKSEEPKKEETPKPEEKNKTVESKPSSPVSEKIKKIILDIEKKFSYCKDGVISGRTDFTDVDPFIVQYIIDTIGWDSWTKMSENLKAQIYGFCFQSDSNLNKSGGYKLRWISSLYFALDQKYRRTEIRDCKLKPKETPSDEKLKFAINTIKTACDDGSINTDDILKKYIELILGQYLGLAQANEDLKDDYIPIWRQRPESIDRAVRDEDMKTILSDWQTFIDKYEYSPGTNDPNSVDWVLKTDNANTSSNKQFDIQEIFKTDEFKEVKKLYEIHKKKTSFSDIVSKEIVKQYDANMKELEKIVNEWNNNKTTQSDILKKLEDKIKEAEESTGPFGSRLPDEAEKFKKASIKLLNHIKDKIVPKYMNTEKL